MYFSYRYPVYFLSVWANAAGQCSGQAKSVVALSTLELYCTLKAGILLRSQGWNSIMFNSNCSSVVITNIC